MAPLKSVRGTLTHGPGTWARALNAAGMPAHLLSILTVNSRPEVASLLGRVLTCTHQAIETDRALARLSAAAPHPHGHGKLAGDEATAPELKMPTCSRAFEDDLRPRLMRCTRAQAGRVACGMRSRADAETSGTHAVDTAGVWVCLCGGVGTAAASLGNAQRCADLSLEHVCTLARLRDGWSAIPFEKDGCARSRRSTG